VLGWYGVRFLPEVGETTKAVVSRLALAVIVLFGGRAVIAWWTPPTKEPDRPVRCERNTPASATTKPATPTAAASARKRTMSRDDEARSASGSGTSRRVSSVSRGCHMGASRTLRVR